MLLLSTLLACSTPPMATRAPDALPVRPAPAAEWRSWSEPPPVADRWDLDLWRLNVIEHDRVIGWSPAGIAIHRGVSSSTPRPGEARIEWIDVETGAEVAERESRQVIALSERGTWALVKNRAGLTSIPMNLDEPVAVRPALAPGQEAWSIDDDGTIGVTTSRCSWAFVRPAEPLPAYDATASDCEPRIVHGRGRGGQLLRGDDSISWLAADGRTVALGTRNSAAGAVHDDVVAIPVGSRIELTDLESGEQRTLQTGLQGRQTTPAWSSDGRLATTDGRQVELWDGDQWICRIYLAKQNVSGKSQLVWSPDDAHLMVWTGVAPTLVDVERCRIERHPTRAPSGIAEIDRLLVVQDLEGIGVVDRRSGQWISYGGRAELAHRGDNGIELTGAQGRLWVSSDSVAWVAPSNAQWAWIGENQLLAFVGDRGWAIDPDTGRVIGEVDRPEVPDCVPDDTVWSRGVAMPPVGPADSCPPQGLVDAPNIVSLDPSWTRAFTRPSGIAHLDGRGVRIQALDDDGPYRSGALWSEDGGRALAWDAVNGRIALWDTLDSRRLASWSVQRNSDRAQLNVAMDRAGEVVAIGPHGDRSWEVHRVAGGPICSLPRRGTEDVALLGPRGDHLLLTAPDGAAMVDVLTCQRIWTTGRPLSSQQGVHEWDAHFPSTAP